MIDLFTACNTGTFLTTLRYIFACTFPCQNHIAFRSAYDFAVLTNTAVLSSAEPESRDLSWTSHCGIIVAFVTASQFVSATVHSTHCRPTIISVIYLLAACSHSAVHPICCLKIISNFTNSL